MLTMRSRARRGFVAIEVLVTLILSMLVLAILCATLLAQSRLTRAIGERVAFNDASRATLHIVASEVRLLNAGRDMRAIAPDSVAARWFRASGTVCAASNVDVWVRMHTVREPDPSKDSLLFIGAGAERAAKITSATVDASHCATGAGETAYRMRLSASAPGGGAALMYESGSYYLSTHALRYRLGGEGRQPLTEEFMRDGVSAFALVAPPVFGGATAVPSFRITLSMQQQMQHTSSRQLTMLLAMPNGSQP